MRRLGVLISGFTEADAEGQARVTALRLGLLEHGWVEGRNLEIHYRWGGADPSRMRVYAAASSFRVAMGTMKVICQAKGHEEILPSIFRTRR